MMSRNDVLLILALLTFHIVISSSSERAQSSVLVSNEAAKVRAWYLDRLIDFEASVVRLQEVGALLEQGSPARKAFTAQFLETRRRYKHCEMFAEYFSPAAAKSINGAARDEVEEFDPNQNLILAQGLQVIESLTFPEYDPTDSAALRVQLGNLVGNSIKLRTITEAKSFTDGQIFDAIRLEIVRMISLGITGFDAMVVETSMSEAAEALRSIGEVVAIYEGAAPAEYATLAAHLDRVDEYLHTNPDFATFDRVTFIRDFANPLSRSILGFQTAAGISLPEGRRALRAEAATAFDAEAFDAAYYAPTSEVPTADQIALGKMLFFDPILSKNNRRACASCHEPERAFTDGKAKSIALDFEGNVGRNSPTLLNSALQRSYFYDSRVSYLEDQVVAVMTSHKEFDCTPDEIVSKLSQSEEYQALFAKAFPNDKAALQVANLKSALANFVRSLTSLNSPFDRYLRAETKTIPENVRSGFNLFAGKAKCATCHFVPLFNGTVPPYFDKSEFEMLGALISPDTVRGTIDPDLGRMSIDRIELNRHGFKTPTVRNVALSAPYIHNGAYKTLEDVLHFYNHGGGAGIGLDVPNQTLPPEKLQMTKQEMADIIAFLHALTDTSRTVTPTTLPRFPSPVMAARRVGGEY